MRETRRICLSALVLIALAMYGCLRTGHIGGVQYATIVRSTFLMSVLGILAGTLCVLEARGARDFGYELVRYIVIAAVCGAAIPLVSSFFDQVYVLPNTLAYYAALATTIFAVLVIHGREDWSNNGQLQRQRSV